MKKILLSIFAVAMLSGCTHTGQGERVQLTKTHDERFNVQFLFEADGVKVYRFVDDGRYIYFTNANGKCRYTDEQVISNGKTTMVVSTDVETMCNANN